MQDWLNTFCREEDCRNNNVWKIKLGKIYVPMHVCIDLRDYVIIYLAHSINKVLRLASTIYRVTFFKEINDNGDFHESEVNQHYLLYRQLRRELFSMHGLFFSFYFTKAHVCKNHVYLIYKHF